MMKRMLGRDLFGPPSIEGSSTLRTIAAKRRTGQCQRRMRYLAIDQISLDVYSCLGDATQLTASSFVPRYCMVTASSERRAGLKAAKSMGHKPMSQNSQRCCGDFDMLDKVRSDGFNAFYSLLSVHREHLWLLHQSYLHEARSVYTLSDMLLTPTGRCTVH